MYSVDGQKFEACEIGIQSVLERAYKNHVRPMCLCSAASIPVYITCLGGTFVLKRMPCTGSLYAVYCVHYESPGGSPDSADIGTAISNDPNTGLTHLNVDFSLSHGPSRPTSLRTVSAVSSAHAGRPSLSLRGLLQFLWNEAELTNWKPAFAGKRSWAVVRHRLLRAAAKKVIRGQPLANVTFVPESFTVAHKEQIAARRASRLADGLRRSAEGQGKMIVIGEIKEIFPARSAFNVVLKHLPDLPFCIHVDTYRRMNRNFENELSLWRSAADVHLIIAATFTLPSAAQPLIEELSLLPTSAQWIPADDAFELRLVDSLVHQDRSFQKFQRLNAKVPALSPSAILLDVKPARIGLALHRDADDSVDATAAAELDSSPGWLWRIREQDLPAFPQ